MDLATLREFEGTALSFDDLQQIMKNATGLKAKIVQLNNIKANQRIHDIFGMYNAIIIYIPVLSKFNGHYVCGFIENNNLYFIDSYGNSPAQLLRTINNMGNVKDSSTLFRIMRDSGLTGYMNTVDYQSHSPSVSCCGRYATSVLIMRHMCHKNGVTFDLNRYNSMITKYKNDNNYKSYDDAITAFTLSFG